MGKKNATSDSYYSISSYWENFINKTQTYLVINNLNWYFNIAKKELKENKNCGKANKPIIKGIVKLLRLQGIKRSDGQIYYSNTFLDDLRKTSTDHYHLFNKKLIEWDELLFLDQDVDWSTNSLKWNVIVRDIKSLITPFFVGDFNPKVSEFVKYQAMVDSSINDTNNPYTYKYNNDIVIEIDTISGVKGQTHQATLLLETFNRGFDLQFCLPFILNLDKKPKLNNITRKQRISKVYVAMTRPEKLLCLAMRKDSLLNYDGSSKDLTEEVKKLSEIGWKVEIIHEDNKSREELKLSNK